MARLRLQNIQRPLVPPIQKKKHPLTKLLKTPIIPQRITPPKTITQPPNAHPYIVITSRQQKKDKKLIETPE